MDTFFSKFLIPSFVQKYDIVLSKYKNSNYNTFNEFFTRELKDNNISKDKSKILSPADGKILVYQNIDSKQHFKIKNDSLDINKILKNNKLAKVFKNGSIAIIRLAPVDYHRFHFPISGEIGASTEINGDLYSVSPISIRIKPNVFFENKREFSLIQNKDFGRIAYCEVGATFVGSIIQTYKSGRIEQGDEKGFFKFGGSTVILIFEKNKVTFDTDLIENTQAGIETKINIGEQIGFLKK